MYDHAIFKVIDTDVHYMFALYYTIDHARYIYRDLFDSAMINIFALYDTIDHSANMQTNQSAIKFAISGLFWQFILC